MSNYRKKLIVEPGSKIRLKHFDPGYHGKHESHESALESVSGSMIWNSSSMPRVKTCSLVAMLFDFVDHFLRLPHVTAPDSFNLPVFVDQCSHQPV